MLIYLILFCKVAKSGIYLFVSPILDATWDLGWPRSELLFNYIEGSGEKWRIIMLIYLSYLHLFIFPSDNKKPP